MNKVLLWNKGLSLLSILNIIYIIHYYFTSKKMDNTEKKMYIFVFIYTLVCSIRAVWPRMDNERVCLYNNFISKPIIGRILATIAELSFAFLILLVTQQIINFTKLGKTSLILLNNLTFALIIFAQIMCWVGVITIDHLWNAVEESCWTIFSILYIIIYSTIYFKILKLDLSNKKNKMIYTFIPFFIIALLCYAIFMIKVDIPMYLKHSKEYKGKYFNLFNGLEDLSKCKETSSSMKYWKDEIPWMTSYFTLAVWFSIYIFLWYRSFNK